MTTNTDINTLAQQLRDAALKATKGLWYRAMMRFNGITTNEITSVLFHGEAEAIIASTVEKRDAEFIALANPINIQLILNALESAQRQVTHLEKCLSEQENISSGFHVGLKYASARIKELEASQPVAPEWISVSDRLPENETLVLTIDKNSFINTAVFVHGDGYSFLCNFNFRQIPSVTHWMPLPASPAPQEG